MSNPNPSPATRFKKGQVANPGGKTKEQRKIEIEAAKIAGKLRLKALQKTLEDVESGEMDAAELVEPSMLKLFKDSEDRAHGTARQEIDHTTNGKDINQEPTEGDLIERAKKLGIDPSALGLGGKKEKG